jgi:hypothetical protein
LSVLRRYPGTCLKNLRVIASRDSSVGVATGYWLDGGGSISDRDREFSILHKARTGFEVHPTSYPMGFLRDIAARP